jgi:hypothetical protein
VRGTGCCVQGEEKAGVLGCSFGKGLQAGVAHSGALGGWQWTLAVDGGLLEAPVL